ncbi:cytochrome P450 4c21-like [Tetranychus urticae]|uniref:Cytochrome P450 n=1 Tax=Tetranychus urticae TaxID=32264 RepID=T1K4K6_TETUR|nr:cytochrome P450 4c21-like [Tetranychus urticae]
MAFSGLMSVESLKLGLLPIVSYFIYVYLLKPALHFVHRAIHYHGFPCYPRNFIFGHSLLFWTNFPFPYNLESFQRMFHEATNKLAAHDQDQSLTVCWLTLHPNVLPVSHEAVEVIMNKKNVRKQFFYKFMGLGNGLVASEPALWKVRRKLIEPFFSTKKIKGYAKHMDQEVKSFTQQLNTETGKPVDLEDQIHSSTLNIILKSALSIPLDDSIEDKKSLTELVNKVEPNLVRRSLNPLYHIDWVAKFTKFGRYYFETLDLVEKVLARMLNRRKQLLSSTSHESENQDFVSLLEGKVDQQGFFDELITMIAAGHETTAVGLRWILFNLGHHPDVQERLYREIVQFFPDDTPVDDMDKINQCNYLDQCIKESLRLNPPIHVFARYLEEDVVVKDKRLLKDTGVLVSCPIIHHNPNVYPDPEKYDPDRWTPENASKIPKAAYIPFGYGPRSCIGYRYAILELKIYTIQIIRKFSLRSTRKHESIPSKFEITLKPCLPLEIIVTPRNNN